MYLSAILALLKSALELGLITGVTVLALYLSYSMLNICDLSTDGCFTLGACVAAMVSLTGHPFLAILAAIGAGVLSGLLTAFLQTKMGVNSLLAGIIVNTGLYSINIAIMGNSSLVNMNKASTLFSLAEDLLEGTFLESFSSVFVALIFVVLIVLFYSIFLKTRLGLSLRATGDNEDMVKASSINPTMIILVGLALSGAVTALSGALQASYQKAANIDIGSGIVTVALASLLIGNTFFKKGSITLRAIGAVLGSIVFRLVYTIALRLNMPAFMLKLISAVIVVIAISAPYLKSKLPLFLRQKALKKGGH